MLYLFGKLIVLGSPLRPQVPKSDINVRYGLHPSRREWLVVPIIFMPQLYQWAQLARPVFVAHRIRSW